MTDKIWTLYADVQITNRKRYHVLVGPGKTVKGHYGTLEKAIEACVAEGQTILNLDIGGNIHQIPLIQPTHNDR